MNKPELIKRNFTFEARAEHDERGDLIEGKPIVYDSMCDLGFMNEIIEKGALNDTDLKDVRFLVNHNLEMIPLARSRKNNKNSTMQLIPDENGLNIKTYLDTENNATARSLYSAVKRGDISGMSFLFSVGDEEWEDLDTDKPTRRIKSISSVVEVSAVTIPAYEDTEIYARDKNNLEKLRQKLESEKQNRAKSLENDKKSKLNFEQRTLLKMYGGK